MASISTAIKLNDQMTAPLRNITNAMNMMLSTWDSLESSTASGLDVGNVEAVRAELNRATQALDNMGDEQQEFNQMVHQGSSAVDGMTGKILGMVGAYGGMQAIKNLVNMSDEFSQTTARLNMINDGLQTTEELTDKIFASAQRSRASFTDVADTVAKLSLNAGDAFSSNDEAILFAENLNKLYAIAGTSQASIASSTLQLTQALGSGVLRGEEFNAVFEAAPNIMHEVAEYMNVPVGQLRNMAAEGKITADIVKKALLGATKDINSQFEEIPMTWSQVWTGITNELYYATIPILEVISLLAQNWSILEPLVIGVTVALGLYTAALAIGKTITTLSAIATAFHTAMTSGWSIATFTATVAQKGLNAALLACPLTWFVMILIGVLAIFYAIIAAINKFTGTTISATGIITGVVYSLFSFLWNIVAAFVNFFASVWDDPIGSIARLFGDLADSVLGVLELIAKGIDKVFGSHLADTVGGWRDSLSGMIDKEFGAGKVIMPEMDTVDAFTTGYEWGEGLEDSVGSMFGGDLPAEYPLEGLTAQMGDVVDNTGATADALTISNEDLKYMRDLAEQEVINRFTTAEVKVDLGGVTNNVNSNVDLDGVVDYLATGVEEAMVRIAEGVHN